MKQTNQISTKAETHEKYSVHTVLPANKNNGKLNATCLSSCQCKLSLITTECTGCPNKI